MNYDPGKTFKPTPLTVMHWGHGYADTTIVDKSYFYDKSGPMQGTVAFVELSLAGENVSWYQCLEAQTQSIKWSEIARYCVTGLEHPLLISVPKEQQLMFAMFILQSEGINYQVPDYEQQQD